MIDAVEAKLKPKQLAMKYVDEFRRYPTLLEFHQAQAKLTFRESELGKACTALSQQAQDRYPGSTPQEIGAHNKLTQTLFTEFYALTTLILNVNRTIELKCEMFGMSGLLVQSLTMDLQDLIWQDPSLITASVAAEWIKLTKSSNGDRKQRRVPREILQRFAYTKMMRRVPGLLLKSVNGLLLMHLYSYQMAVQNLQERYFDGHPILSHEVEDALKDTIEILLKTIGTYKEYVKDRDLDGCTVGLRNRSHDGTGTQNELDGEPELADLEGFQKGGREMADKVLKDWATDAHDQGVAAISPGTPDLEDLLWKNFQKKYGA